MEIDSFTPPQQPAWKVILGVNDANHLRQTLNTILTATRFEASQEEDNGITDKKAIGEIFDQEIGAVEWIRTTTVLLPPAPQAGASASSATTAQR